MDFVLDTIGARQIALVHSSKLNDPFDPYLFFETDFNADYEVFKEFVSVNHPNDLSWFCQSMSPEMWRTHLNNFRDYCVKERESIYVFSTSAVYDGEHPKDNLYMWSHYANGHRGVAIEFNTKEIGQRLLEDEGKERGVTLKPEEMWVESEYVSNFSSITCSIFFDHLKGTGGAKQRTKLDMYYEIMGRIKSTNWKSENEWRLMWYRNDTKRTVLKVPLSETAIERVYIGMLASPKDQADVMFEAKRQYPAAQVFKAAKRSGAFALDFKPLT
jgi:hypothetical protein